MAKKSRTKKAQPKSSSSKSTARGLVDEVEKAGESLLREIREGFDTISDKVSVAAKSAAEGIADTTASVADRVSKTQTTQQIKSALEHIETVGERVIDVLSERFEILKNRVVATSKPTVKKKAAKKVKTAVKKAAKKAAPAAKKKKTAAKKASKKKVAKKAPPKKAAKKKTATKKAAKKKVSSKGKKS
ncbi:MAG: hypothetical protein PVF82_19430 [Gammaproteobacteria bacterium]|jgi:hypothetical protein